MNLILVYKALDNYIKMCAQVNVPTSIYFFLKTSGNTPQNHIQKHFVDTLHHKLQFFKMKYFD